MGRISDPHPCYADPDPGFEIFADIDPGFEIFAELDSVFEIFTDPDPMFEISADPGLDFSLKKHVFSEKVRYLKNLWIWIKMRFRIRI